MIAVMARMRQQNNAVRSRATVTTGSRVRTASVRTDSLFVMESTTAEMDQMKMTSLFVCSFYYGSINNYRKFPNKRAPPVFRSCKFSSRAFQWYITCLYRTKYGLSYIVGKLLSFAPILCLSALHPYLGIYGIHTACFLPHNNGTLAECTCNTNIREGLSLIFFLLEECCSLNRCRVENIGITTGDGFVKIFLNYCYEGNISTICPNWYLVCIQWEYDSYVLLVHA